MFIDMSSSSNADRTARNTFGFISMQNITSMIDIVDFFS